MVPSPKIQQGFADVVRAILGYGAYNTNSSIPIHCAGGHIFTTEEDPLHGNHCCKNGPEWTKRHTNIERLLFPLIKACRPEAIVTMETKVGQRIVNKRLANGQIEPVITDVYCDILVKDGPDTYILDILVVDPSAPFYNITTNNRPRAFETVNAAAITGEIKKRRHYNRVSLPAPIPPDSVIPFVIEATGRLGPSALAYLFKICSTQTFRRSQFIKSVSLICARYTGQFIKTSRDPIHANPQNGVL